MVDVIHFEVVGEGERKNAVGDRPYGAVFEEGYRHTEDAYGGVEVAAAVPGEADGFSGAGVGDGAGPKVDVPASGGVEVPCGVVAAADAEEGISARVRGCRCGIGYRCHERVSVAEWMMRPGTIPFCSARTLLRW